MDTNRINDHLVPVDFDPFSGPELIGMAPAVEPQLEIWLSCMLGGDDASRSYNEAVSLRLQGFFNYDAMRYALRDLIQRHEALRSTFSADGKTICILKDVPLEIHFEDISQQTQDSQGDFLQAYSKKNAETVFDLSKGPLFRFAVIKLATEEHYLIVSAHHIICDGWSLGIMLQDVGKLYSAYAKNEMPQLPGAFQFSQYALEEQAFSKTEGFNDTVQYWVNQYKDSVPVLNIPTDFPRPHSRTYKSQRDDYAINTELVTGIKKIGAKSGCSFVTTLLSAFEVYLYRLTGQKEIVLGLPAAGQSATAHYNLVGHCVNLLPLKTSFDEQMSFVDYLKKRKKQIFDDYDHQRFTFGTLLKELNIVREPSRVPLVPVVFNIDMGLDDGVEFYGLKHQLGYSPREYENFEIFLNASGSEQMLVLEWSYNTQLFKPESIHRMMDEFKTLLQSIVNEPAIRISEIPLKPLDEIYSNLKIWNNTVAEYPRDKVFQDLFYHAANEHTDNSALRFGKQVFSYRNLNEKSNQFAAYLVRQGVLVGDVIALALDRSPEMVITLLAILKSGATYVPVDPQFPAKRVEFMLQDSSAKILITTKNHKGKFHSKSKELLIDDVWPKLPEFPKEDFKANINSGNLAYILYTSGSTGNPKGVKIAHQSLVNFLLSMQKKPGINSRDSFLAITTISFDIAGLELYLPLITGAELVLADAESAKDGRLLVELLEDSKSTIMQATPSTWRMMVEAGWKRKLPIKILCGGEALPKDLADKLLERCSSLWNMYGPTETTIWSAIKQIKIQDQIITIGRPIDNTQIYILDNNLKPIPEGSIGEIYIGGDGVAKGYLNRPELTNEKFVEDPFIGILSGKKIYRTGDLGKFMANGEIQCLGRIDHQVKLHGFRIELEEIEQALNKQKKVQQSVVVAVNEKLIAYVVPDMTILKSAKSTKGQYTSDEEVQLQILKWKKALKDLLPDYMVPKEFVVLEKFPLTPNNKIDRKALPEPIGNAGMESQHYVAPSSDTERLIAEIWERILEIEKISVQDDFFEIGGHSLVAVQAMTQLEQKTGKRLPLASLFEAPTIEKLAKLVDTDVRAFAYDSLVAIKPNGKKTPLYIVHGFGMNVLLFNNVAKNMDPEQPVFALQAKGLNASTIDNSLESMEDIAAYYISEIVHQNPNGPYALAGYSFGGIVAFEMAKQLEAMGKEVKMVAMFDTYADNSNYFNPFLLNITKKFRRQIPKMFFILRSLAKQPWETILYQVGFVKKKFNQVFGKIRKKVEDGPTYNQLLEAKYEYAYTNYKMAPYDGEIDLFKVKTRLYYLDDMIYLGWKDFAKKGVNVYEISGDHKTFLYPPHDKEFAEILQKTLDERLSNQSGKKDKPMLKAV